MILTYREDTGASKMIRLKAISHAKPITLGRGAENDIILNDSVCSRVHAAIRYWDDIFVVRDMGSHNGTLLNGEKIEVAVLHPGDTLKIGNTELNAAAEEGSGRDVTVISSPKGS
mgnify:CR=1 FL=1